MARFETVSFLSDYGSVDEFAGVVRSVIRQLASHAAVVDITHDVPAYDVRSGGLTLARAAQYLAPGVILAVVDPAVGTSRRAIAVEVGDGASVLVGPDNGLLAPAVSMLGGATRAIELTNADFQLPAPGPTFAGRDVFAPAAAHLCSGVELAELGPDVDPATLTPGMIPITQEKDGALVAEVLWTDRFGNLQLNVDPDEINGFGDRIELRFDRRARTGVRHDTYAGIPSGEVGLVVDSYGLVTIAADRSSAADELGIGTGDEVVLAPIPDDGPPAGVVTPVTLKEKR